MGGWAFAYLGTLPSMTAFHIVDLLPDLSKSLEPSLSCNVCKLCHYISHVNHACTLCSPTDVKREGNVLCVIFNSQTDSVQRDLLTSCKMCWWPWALGMANVLFLTNAQPRARKMCEAEGNREVGGGVLRNYYICFSFW